MKRLMFLVSLIYGLMALGLGTLNGDELILVTPLVIYLASGLLFGPDALRVAVTRTISADRTEHDELVSVKLTVTNNGSRLEEVWLEDVVSRPVDIVDGAARLLTTLLAGATTEVAYALRAKRGVYRFPGLRVTAGDHFSLFRRQALVSAPAQLLVTPGALRLRRLEIRPRRTRVYSGFVPAHQGGPGVEFFGVRDYQPGDPLHWINWRASARHPDTYYTTEFEQERVADVAIILDARIRSDVLSRHGSLFECAAQAAAMLAETFLNDGNRVGLLVYGSILDWTFPGYGKTQRERILQALARAEPGGSLIFDKLDVLPSRLFPLHSQIVLISPLVKDDLPMLVRLRARGYQVLIVSPDPIPLEMEMLRATPEADLAARIVRLERRSQISQLRQAGIYVLDWDINTPLDQALFAMSNRPLAGPYARGLS